eukprot:scaffold1386_cov342-Pavlova_lutheri.AAC.25
MQFDSPSGEPPKHRGQRGCDSHVFQRIPIAVLFRSSRWLTTPTRQQLSTPFSLHPSLPTLPHGNPSIRPSIRWWWGGGALPPCPMHSRPPASTLLAAQGSSRPIDPMPRLETILLVWEHLLQTGTARVDRHDCTEVQPMDEQVLGCVGTWAWLGP